MKLFSIVLFGRVRALNKSQPTHRWWTRRTEYHQGWLILKTIACFFPPRGFSLVFALFRRTAEGQHRKMKRIKALGWDSLAWHQMGCSSLRHCWTTGAQSEFLNLLKSHTHSLAQNHLLLATRRHLHDARSHQWLCALMYVHTVWNRRSRAMAGTNLRTDQKEGSCC